MAAFRTGDTLVWIIGPVLDDSGAAVTGASFAAVVALKPDGTSFSPTYTEVGNGVYKATVVSTARGLWFLYSQATVSGVVYQDAGSITVDDELAYTASGAAGSVGAALANIDAAVSSRAATSALSNLDVAVSSRLSAASAATPLANLDVAVSSRASSATFANLDVPVSSRLAASAYVAPSGNVVMTTAPVAVNGIFTLIKSTDYKLAETRSLDWTTSDAGTWPDLTGAAIILAAAPSSSLTRPGFSVAGTVVTPTGTAKHVRVEIPASLTASLTADTYDYQLRATLPNGDVIPLATGSLNVQNFIPA